MSPDVIRDETIELRDLRKRAMAWKEALSRAGASAKRHVG